MSKYQPLSDRLRGHPADEWRASFTEIEDVLGFPLPKSARQHRAWWGNEATTDKPHKKAWLEPGWKADEVDQTAGVVTFRRGAVSPAAVAAAAGLAPVGDLSAEAPPVPEPAPSPPSAALLADPAAPQAASKAKSGKGIGVAALAAGVVAVAVGIGAVAVGGLLRRRVTSPKPLDIASRVRKGVDRLQRRS